eukprot:1140248-Pelagomonas_calceolata.AAC.1
MKLKRVVNDTTTNTGAHAHVRPQAHTSTRPPYTRAYNQIVQQQRQWVIVQVQGFSPVIYVNCVEEHPVEVLRKGLQNDFWQEAPVTGGSGGGANHPNGVILLGPEGLAPFRDQLNTPPPPDNALKPETVSKLNRGTLRVVPPTTYLKMCRVFKKKMNTYKFLRRGGQSKACLELDLSLSLFAALLTLRPIQTMRHHHERLTGLQHLIV